MKGCAKKSNLMGKKAPIYLDYQSTTPTDPRVLEKMLPYFNQTFGNPHSKSHSFGWVAKNAVETARAKVARLLGAESDEIIFTSGATEANNLVIKGLSYSPNRTGDHIVTTSIEHKCILESCKQVELSGIRVSYVKVDTNGVINLENFKKSLDKGTFLVSVMGVNNEIGVVQPLEEIGKICKSKGIYFHSDCAQAVGKIPLDVNRLNLDLMSISGHKFYAPMGIGAVYVRKRPRVRLTSLLDGGGQEKGLRAGTLPVPLCIGLGEAAAIAEAEIEEEVDRVKNLRDTFLSYLKNRSLLISVNGSIESRISGNLNLCLVGINMERLLADLKGVALSTGSACDSGSVEPSYVLKALGMSDKDIKSSMRIGFGRFTTIEEVCLAAEKLADGIEAQIMRKNEARKDFSGPKNDSFLMQQGIKSL